MTFDDILADCIEALEQGATIRECLTRYPAHATALEPLLQLVFSLSRESQTRLSAQAFLRGRQALAAQAQQRRAHHRRPKPPVFSTPNTVQPATYTHNGLPYRRPVTQKHTWGSLGMPRLLRTALVLLLLLGSTTFFRQVLTSLPGTTLYPVKSTGEQLVAVLMEAAGEGTSWHATQAERRLQELAQLTNPDVTTVQTLSHVVETHWEAMLTASEGLPTAEREALLQAQIARLRQLEATWTASQADIPLPAVATVRKLITTGEAALSQPIDTPTPVLETVTATSTPTVLITAMPTLTPTPLLQASATAALPVLVPSPTPVVSPTPVATLVDLVTPTVEIQSPTAPVSEPPSPTPLPQITVQMPQQESSNQQTDEEHNDTDASTATATATAPTEEPTKSSTVSPTDITTPGAEEGTATPAPTGVTVTPLPLTPATTEVQSTSVAMPQTPQATTAIENTPAVPTKTAPSATATAGLTPEPMATSTARPTTQATATRTPKPTATHSGAPTATPDSNNATAAPTTAVENTPAPTSQPTTPPRDETLQTPSSVSVTPVFSQPVKPRPTTPGGEPTKEGQP